MRGNSSAGRALPCQGKGRGFESRFPLQNSIKEHVPSYYLYYLKGPMKSLMEEASSVSKAIEQGWTNAGKPKEFSVKIYEEPQKNFFGLTTQPAKIGIFFAETTKKAEIKPRRETEIRKQKPLIEREKTYQKVESKKTEPSAQPSHEDLGPIWSDEMVSSIQEWLGEIVYLMGFERTIFSVGQQHFHLRIVFKRPLLDDKDRQKHLFAIMSGLLLTMLKRQYKRPLRGYKVVLTEGN